MNLKEKLAFIQTNHFGDWLKTRDLVEDELSQKNGMSCYCGRLATGLHERYCTRFQNKVSSETVKRLAHLIVKPN